LGGGGPGGNGTVGTAGNIYTGGGGGGGNWPNFAGGNGGSGVVILRYPTVYPIATANTGSNVIYTTSGGYRIYKFSASGTITF
jgi:hypothetical protein